MTRRRFFPSSPAQALPGRTVELEMQLPKPAAAQPVQAVDAPAGGGSVGWLVPDLLTAAPEGLVSATLPDGRVSISGINYGPDIADYRGLIDSIWSGAPPALDDYGHARPWPAPGFVCQELDIDASAVAQWPSPTYIALLHGAAEWSFEWDTPFVEDAAYSYPSFHFAQIQGGVMRVQLNFWDGSLAIVQTLTATATQNGVAVAQLILRVHRFVY